MGVLKDYKIKQIFQSGDLKIYDIQFYSGEKPGLKYLRSQKLKTAQFRFGSDKTHTQIIKEINKELAKKLTPEDEFNPIDEQKETEVVVEI